LAPISSLGRERWRHDEAAHALVGEESGRRYPLGMRVEARLEEAAPVSGGLIFTVLTEPLAPAPSFKRARRSKQTEPRRGRRRR
jgi:ribonuclease R